MFKDPGLPIGSALLIGLLLGFLLELGQLNARLSNFLNDSFFRMDDVERPSLARGIEPKAFAA